MQMHTYPSYQIFSVLTHFPKSDQNIKMLGEVIHHTSWPCTFIVTHLRDKNRCFHAEKLLVSFFAQKLLFSVSDCHSGGPIAH